MADTTIVLGILPYTWNMRGTWSNLIPTWTYLAIDLGESAKSMISQLIYYSHGNIFIVFSMLI